MNADSPTAPDRGRAWRVLGWALLVAVVAAAGWSGWRAHDYRAAVREARAARFVFEESPAPFAAIRADWHAALSLATWTERERELDLPDGTDLAPLRPLLLRLDPTKLTASGCRQVDALRGLTRLRILDLSGSDVKDLAPLAGLGQLRLLDLRGCTGVVDLAPLAGLMRLQQLYLGGTGVADLAPLASLAQLHWLDLWDCTGLGEEAVAAFQKGHPQVRGHYPNGLPLSAE